MLLANLNTIADDNTGLNLLEARYTHELFDKALSITAGKAKNLMFLDGNAFANNEKQQFVLNPGGDSKNDPVFAGMIRAEFNF